MSVPLTSTLLILCALILAQLPSPWTNQEIGGPAPAGSSTESSGTFTVEAGGADIWGTSDEFHFIWQQVTGDFSIISRVVSQTNTNSWAKAGVMARESLDTDAANVFTMITPGNGVRQQRRTTTGDSTSNEGIAGSTPIWLRLDRNDDNFDSYSSSDGINWTFLASSTISMDTTIYLGLAATSHNTGALSTVTFDNVSIGDPPEPPTTPEASTDGYVSLFNGNDLTNWYTFLEDGIGVDNDPDGIFKIVNEQIHLLDLADTSVERPFGYFSTNESYRNYRLRFEYQWGTKKYPPRANLLRDSGLLYHFIGSDTVWPTCIESQVQETDTGDFFTLGNTRLDTTVTGSNTYQPAGTPLLDTGSRIIHSAQHDTLTGWNVVDTIVTEDESIHIVNGFVNNRGTNFTFDGSSLAEGKIALQVEGAEIFYRNIELKPLFTTGGGPDYKVLVFSKTTGFRHGSIPDGITAVEALGERNGFTVDTTEDATMFNDTTLAEYDCVIWMNTSGTPLDSTQQAAFERYIQAGGGYVGVHAASDTHRSGDWPWYEELVGALFVNHPSIQHADLCVCEACHPSTESLGTDMEWIRRDEWYNFDRDPADNPNITVLVTLDETSYNGGTMGTSHPITWCQEYDGGRSWYTGMGHTSETYEEPQFRIHLLGGIEWAAGKSSKATSDKTVLFGGTDTSSWEKLSDGTAIDWPIVDGSLEVNNGNIVTTDDYGDFRLHLEFRPNSTNTNVEQNRGNSGVYLQGRYEIQILDSYNWPLADANDCGAIYNVRNASSNEAWPADAWQHYDIWFRAARWDGNTKTENARVTVFWNGVRIHDSVEIPDATLAAAFSEGPTDGPLMLQDHGNAVRFRNIWIEPGAALPPPLDDSIQICSIDFSPTNYEVTLTWDSALAGPFDIYAGADLSVLGPAPNNILPISVSSEATSPLTFTLPASLQGSNKVFFQVAESP